MSLVNGGLVDYKFFVINMCKDFGWTYQEFLARPLWFDSYYQIKLRAEAKHQEIESQKTHE